MLRKINQMLNIIIGGASGTFLGYSIYMTINHCMHPERYIYYSAPWYTGIMVYGFLTIAVIIIAFSGKFIIKRKIKRNKY